MTQMHQGLYTFN